MESQKLGELFDVILTSAIYINLIFHNLGNTFKKSAKKNDGYVI